MAIPGLPGGRSGILSLTIKDKAVLYAAFMPHFKNGGLFIPTNKDYKLGEEVFLLLNLMDEAEKLVSELKKEAAGRRRPLKNQFVVELAEFYETHTGRKASAYTHKPLSPKGEQYEGKALSFIKSCLDKAKIEATDEAIVQVIRSMNKSLGDN